MTRDRFVQLQVGDKVRHPFGGIGIVTDKDAMTYTVKDKGFDCGDGLDEVTFAWNEGEIVCMNELEKKAYAYATDRQKDPNYPSYNWETEITDAYEQGYKDAVDKVLEFMRSCEGYVVCGEKCNYDNFMKFMEEQQ